jgi:hypothetical protein
MPKIFLPQKTPVGATALANIGESWRILAKLGESWRILEILGNGLASNKNIHVIYCQLPIAV